MENEAGDYLQVPITDHERVAAGSRSSSNQPLLSGSSHSDDKDFEKEYYVEGPSRFPSIRGESKSLPYKDGKPEGSGDRSYSPSQYTPISPIDEDDIVNAPPLRQRTIHQPDHQYESLAPLPELWQPVWLKRLTLGLIAVLFVVLVVIFVVIWVVFETRNGFFVEDPHGHEFWQYIPTILMVFIVALWRQVDYHCKALLPWDELQKGPVGPTKSLLLDYISPFQFVSLFKAFIHGHIPIIATVSIFLFLKLAMVFSTGTFILLPSQVNQDGFPLVSPLRFDAASFDPDTDLRSISSSPVYAYYGSMALGIPYASGTLQDRAYMPVIFDNRTSETRYPANVTLIGKVDSFVPLMECHVIEGTLQGPATVRQTDAANAYGDGTISFNLPGGDVCGVWPTLDVTALNPQIDIAPARQITGSFQPVFCGTGTDNQLDVGNGPVGLLYTVTDISFEQQLVDDATILTGSGATVATSSSRTVENIVNVICQPDYTITQIEVLNDTTTVDTQVGGITTASLPDTQNKILEGLSASDLTAIFVQAVGEADGLFGETGNGVETTQGSQTLFALMALSHGELDVAVLLEPETLREAAQATFKGIMAQFARQYLASPHDTYFRGRATWEETRFQVNEASICAMIVSFAFAAGCSILLIFLGPRKVVPRDPNSIAAAATILSRSVEVNRLLRREGVPTSENQEAALEGYEFGTAIATTENGQSSFKIVTSEGLPEQTKFTPEKKLKWWHPPTSSIPFAVFVIAIPLILLAVLEILQRISDRDDGIMTVPDDLATDIGTHFLPALVMVIVASLINLIDFNVELFTPWAVLKKGNATHRQSVLSHYLGKSPPMALLESIRTRRFNVLASVVATGVASILAIVAAGLFNTEVSFLQNIGVSMNRLDDFELQWPDSRSQDHGAAGVLNMIFRDDLDYPAFTNRGLVLPSLSTGDQLNFDNGSTLRSSAHVMLPALRPNLLCDIVSANDINVTTATTGEDDFVTDEAVVSVTYELPGNCQLGGINGDSSTLEYRMGINLPPGGRSIFAGRMFDLLFGENSSLYGHAGEFNGQYIGNNPPVGCPSLAFTYGEFQMGFNDVNKVSALVCYQQIQEVSTNVTFVANTTVIDTDQPPEVDESSVNLITNPNSTNNARSFDFRIQDNIMRQLNAFSSDADNEDFDHFFEAVLNYNSSNNIRPTDLIGPTNIDQLEDAINELYRLYMAQAINLNMRRRTSSTQLARRQTTNDDGPATLNTALSRVRLIQNKGPKITLQVMLAIVSALIAFAYFTTPFRRILPCNPCSIAGTMSLLAGSDLCHSLDDGVCECCGKPRRNSFGTIAETIHADNDIDDGERGQGIPHGAEWLKLGLFEMAFAGKRYSMGWWRERGNTGKRRRYGVDIGARADGSDDQDWELGPRASDNSAAPFMVPQGNRGRGDRDARGLYYVPGHSRGGSVGGQSEADVELDGEVHDDGDLGRGYGQGRGMGRGRDAEYRMVGGEA